MRKDSKQKTIIGRSDLARVQGYHEGSRYDRQSYAFQGFKANKYFTSDRFIPLDDRFNRPDGKPLLGYGLEIETNCSGCCEETAYAELLDKIVLAPFPADLFKLQHDGSLGGTTSAECITQVMTKSFIRNQYPAFKTMYDTYFPAFRITCDDGQCGMHTNISNALFGSKPETQEEAIKKLIYFINRNYDLCCAMFHRDPHRTRYCSRIPEYSTKEGAKAIDLHSMPNDHGLCINGSHYDAGRIEVRLVGGQKNFPCFRNTMECIFHLVDAVKRLSWDDLDNLAKVFKGCNQYVFDRLNSYCYRNGTIAASDLEKIRPTIVEEDLL